MGKGRTLLITVAVIGTLILGGALTGTTLAQWRGTASLNGGAVNSGTIGLTANGSTTASLGSLVSSLQPGVAQAVPLTLTNSAPVTSKNLRLALFLDTVTSSNAALNGALQVDARPYTGTCTAATSGFKTIGAGYTTTSLTTSSLPPQAIHTICVTLRLPSPAPSGSQGQSGLLTFTFRGQQVRP